tara:strand:- start:88 stop:240 length:153 start_codon:yes stop_codon:yes gene_type:complete
MSFEPDNIEQESLDSELLKNILSELKKITAVLSEVHDIEITSEDVNHDGN